VHAFAELLRLHRISAALTQEELAERAQVSSKAVSALERGARRAPYPETVLRLAEALGLDATAREEFQAVANRARIRAHTQVAPNNLASQVTSLVGRDADIDEIAALLARHRLVTVTGSGGVGKTRVAVETARRALPDFSDGVWFCDFAPLVDGRSVVAAVGAPLSIHFDERDPIGSLVAKLQSQELLLVLDNCEHLLEHVSALIAALLRGCPHVKILATSRQRFALSGEAAFRLPSLGIESAVQLFVERAELADPHFSVSAEQTSLIADVCQKLDGIPLAIEIAAAQLRTLGASNLFRGLDENFSLLSSGLADAPRRQRTLNAAIDWSYQLLDPHEQAVFRRAAIFAGDFGLDAAKAVCAGDEVAADAVASSLRSLVEKSLVIADVREPEARYMLLESSRQFGDRQLHERSEFATVSHRHAAWAAAFMEAARLTFFVTSRVERDARVSREFKNAYSAMQRMLESPGDTLLAARILGALENLWRVWGRTREAAQLADLLLARVDADAHPEIAGRLLLAKSHALFGLQRLKVLESATTLFERSRNPRELRRCYAHIGSTQLELGDLARAERACAWAATYFALYEPDPDRRALCLADIRAEIFVRHGEYERAREQYAAGIALCSRLGDPNVVLPSCLAGAAELDFIAGDIRLALRKYRSLPLIGDYEHRIYIFIRIAECHVMLGQLDAAMEAASLGLGEDVGQLYMKLLAFQCAAHVAALAGAARDAARLLGFVDACFARSGYHRDRQDQLCYDALRAELKRHLSSNERKALLAEGATLELADAAALATRELPERRFAATPMP
jgi:predicted ATPase/DNA-binding XRE family transcriptional regulator